MPCTNLGLVQYNGKPFRLATHQGEKVVLSPDYVDAVKSDPRLSFDAAVKKVCVLSSLLSRGVLY